jgi:hypothetical protein
MKGKYNRIVGRKTGLDDNFTNIFPRSTRHSWLPAEQGVEKPVEMPVPAAAQKSSFIVPGDRRENADVIWRKMSFVLLLMPVLLRHCF